MNTTPPQDPGAVKIRPMGLDDIAAVTEIDRLSFTMPWPERAFEHELTRNRAAHLWVAEAEKGRQVIGMIAIWLIVDEIHISTLAVHPDFRKLGIASRLLETAVRSGRQMGGVLATLEVRASNQAAQNLYRRYGFEPVGRRKRYYKDNQEDAVLMTLANLAAFEPSP